MGIVERLIEGVQLYTVHAKKSRFLLLGIRTRQVFEESEEPSKDEDIVMKKYITKAFRNTTLPL